MAEDLFFGPFAKIKRARKHITELLNAENTYIAQQPFERFMEPVGNGMFARKVRATKLPDPELATVVADVLGGLRSSLDLAACAVARANGVSDLKHTYFHFAQSEAEWRKSYKGRTRGVPARIKAMMHRLQPWDGGNKILYALGRLSVGDKHQLIIPTAISTGGTTISNGLFCGRGMVIPDTSWDIEKNEATLYLSGPNEKGVEPGVKLQAFFAFGDVEVIPRQPIIPNLNEMADMCSEIVHVFEWITSKRA